MNVFLRSGLLPLAGFALATLSANAQTRMQVAAPSAPLFARPSAEAQPLGSAHSGEILFVSRVDGDWAAISPPERFDVWLNKDFIENFRVAAKSIQIRSGPGIQHDVVGVLERGAPVMPRGEEGDWCKIAPPSSSVLWVKRSNLSEVQTQTTPIREVAAVPPAVAPAIEPVAPPRKTKPAPPPVSKPAVAAAPEKSAAPPEPPPPLPAVSAPVKVAPSTPRAAAPKPAAARPAAPVARPQAPAPAPAPPASPMATAAAPAKPAPAPTIVRPVPPPPQVPPPSAPMPATAAMAASTPPPAAKPTLRPATAIPGVAKPRPVPPPRKVAVVPAAIPAPPAAVAAQKPAEIDVAVDPTFVDDLDLLDQPNQGAPLQVEGELRTAPPFTASAPARYRLLAYDNDVLEIVCHVHGDSAVLRQYIGKGVSIRGREYWVENSDLPVVVVGQIVPLAPADVDEPVLF